MGEYQMSCLAPERFKNIQPKLTLKLNLNTSFDFKINYAIHDFKELVCHNDSTKATILFQMRKFFCNIFVQNV